MTIIFSSLYFKVKKQGGWFTTDKMFRNVLTSQFKTSNVIIGTPMVRSRGVGWCGVLEYFLQDLQENMSPRTWNLIYNRLILGIFCTLIMIPWSLKATWTRQLLTLETSPYFSSNPVSLVSCLVYAITRLYTHT